MSKVRCDHTDVLQINLYQVEMHDIQFEIGYCSICGNLVASQVSKTDGSRSRWQTITKLERRRVSLTRGLANLLYAMHAIVREKQENVIDMLEDTADWSHSRYASVQKLRYWGLVHWVENDDGLKRKTGRWLITRNGALFLKNELAINKFLWVQNNKVVSRDEPMVKISDVSADDSSPYWEQRDDVLYDLAKPDPSQSTMF